MLVPYTLYLFFIFINNCWFTIRSTFYIDRRSLYFNIINNKYRNFSKTNNGIYKILNCKTNLNLIIQLT